MKCVSFVALIVLINKMKYVYIQGVPETTILGFYSINIDHTF